MYTMGPERRVCSIAASCPEKIVQNKLFVRAAVPASSSNFMRNMCGGHQNMCRDCAKICSGVRLHSSRRTAGWSFRDFVGTDFAN